MDRDKGQGTRRSVAGGNWPVGHYEYKVIIFEVFGFEAFRNNQGGRSQDELPFVLGLGPGVLVGFWWWGK